jgi:DNA-binding XRE family transcriptional regulator
MTYSHSTARSLRTLDLDQAAMLLGVSPQTLLAWEARYSFPTSSPSESRYNESEVLALRDSLREGASIAGAVARARKKINRRPPVRRCPAA